MDKLKILLFLSLSLVLCSKKSEQVFYQDNAGEYDFDLFVNKTSLDVSGYNKRIYPKEQSIVQTKFH